MSFCRLCGQKLVKSISEGFNPETGKPNTSYSCPTGICNHTGVEHQWGYSWKRPMLALADCPYCLKCGFWYGELA